MIAPAMSEPTAVCATETTARYWRQLSRVDTVEAAQKLIRLMQDRGVECRLSLVDGLCVLAARQGA